MSDQADPDSLADYLGQHRAGHLSAAPAWADVHHMSVWDGDTSGPEDEIEQESWFESEGDCPFLPEGLHDEEQPWRGLEHPDGWPEFQAGGEYWLYRADADEEDGGK